MLAIKYELSDLGGYRNDLNAFKFVFKISTIQYKYLQQRMLKLQRLLFFA